MLKTSSFGKFVFFFCFFSFSILNVDTTIVTMKAPKHLLNATEQTTWRNRVKTYLIKMLNDLVSYSSQIFKQNLLFFIIENCLNQGQALFYLEDFLGNNFPRFDKSPGKLAKLFKLRKNLFSNKHFSWRYYSIQQVW